MTLKDIQKKYLSSLKGIYPAGEAAAITNIIIEHFTGQGRSAVLLHGDKEPAENTATALSESLKKLLKHIPVQYITGYTIFYGLKFHVDKEVLIPRPETEELVAEAIGFAKKSGAKRIIDIGTGSGCIAISLKKNIGEAEVDAIDISSGALKGAKKNAAENDAVIDFFETDFLDENNWNTLPAYDIIISNPPYIPENEKRLLDRNVAAHEPHTALFVPQNDPLLFYRKIKLFADTHLTKTGKIFLEVHENFAKDTGNLFEENYGTEIKKDIYGKERMLIIYRCR